jgi:phage protein D
MPEQPISHDAVYSATPTVRINGQPYAQVTDLIIGMAMTEQQGGMSELQLRVSNSTRSASGAVLAFEDDQILKLGAAIALYAGDRNAPQEIFRGVITGLEADFPADGVPELIVMAEDMFQHSRMARRTKVWQDQSLADIAKAVASQLNLTPVVTGLDAGLGTIVQLNESALAFLRRLLARYDADLQVVGSEMHVAPRKDATRGTIALELHGQLRRLRAVADLADQVTEVTVSGWDYAQGSRVSEQSTGTVPLPGSGRSGAQLMRDTLGARSEHLGDPAVANAAEAKALAETIFDRRARAFVSVEGTAQGNPGLRVGTQVNLSGVGGRFSNSYYVVRVCHRYDLEHGYYTDFEAECAFLGAGG